MAGSAYRDISRKRLTISSNDQAKFGPSPAALARLQRCKQSAQEAADAGEAASDATENCYRHPDVKESIVNETFEKCAYCESRITHVYWGDVEHIKPKEVFPELRLDYDNLTLACAICNNKKGNYYSDEAAILHPYTDAPAEHLVGLGPFLWHRCSSTIGQRSIDLLDLNRPRLNERRLECLQRISMLADRYANEPEGAVRTVLENQIREEVEDSAEYALVARSFLHAVHNLQWG